jgi:formyl-CoA transferase
MGRTDLSGDPRLVTLKSRVENIDFVDELVTAFTSKRTRTELYEVLARHRVPCAPVRDLDEVVHDPHMHATGMLREVDHPLLGPLVLPTSPMRYGEAPRIQPSKELGADNETVLGDWLGIGAAEIAGLRAEGVV